MEPTENPFVFYNDEKSTSHIVIPLFPRKVKVQVTISEEAWERLRFLIARYTDSAETARGLSDLLERIGVFALSIFEPENIIDEESGISVEDCRNSGYLDAIQGNPSTFLALFGKDLTDKHQEAYMRGYYEGNYINSKRG
jgi:hypothetical protein